MTGCRVAGLQGLYLQDLSEEVVLTNPALNEFQGLRVCFTNPELEKVNLLNLT
jgi:hypothetical protein